MSIKQSNITYPPHITQGAASISRLLKGQYGLSRLAIALLLLQNDRDIALLVRQQEGLDRWQEINSITEKVTSLSADLPSYLVALSRRQAAQEVLRGVIIKERLRQKTWLDHLGDLTMRPPVGIPVLVLVLYFAVYRFVGVFGAGTVVNYLERSIFQAYLNPWVNSFVKQHIPWPVIQDLLAHDYGIVTLGLRYAIAIILPIVGCFFLVFSIIEDSGYLPRLALLVDRLFKFLGLSGRAVIPLTLGFGCGTMAILVTRTLETKREQLMATFLLALAIPCSAQLGVIFALLSNRPPALAIWATFLLTVFFVVGSLLAKVLPGKSPVFYMEVPPLRVPQLGNVFTKTFTRMKWYFFEIVPLFVFSSVLIWLGKITGFFDYVMQYLGRLVICLGLPPEAGAVFLFGFFRRDYGAAGLYDLVAQGVLSTRQLVVTAATLTLFLPCIAQFAVMVKERGLATAVGIAAFIFPFAFGAGYVLNLLLQVGRLV